MIQFSKAVRQGAPPKLAIMGPSGSGKTYSSLAFATGFIGSSGKIAFIDTENSASIYGADFNFDVCKIEPRYQNTPGGRKEMFFWEDFRDAINAAITAGYGFIILDSASHLWEGILSQKALLDASPKGNSFTNWGKAKIGYNAVKNLIMTSATPIICCYRQKEKFEMNQESGGVIRLGLEPIGEPNCMYDYSVVFELNKENNSASIYKNRCSCFTGREEGKPLSVEDGKLFAQWIKQ